MPEAGRPFRAGALSRMTGSRGVAPGYTMPPLRGCPDRLSVQGPGRPRSALRHEEPGRSRPAAQAQARAHRPLEGHRQITGSLENVGIVRAVEAPPIIEEGP